MEEERRRSREQNETEWGKQELEGGKRTGSGTKRDGRKIETQGEHKKMKMTIRRGRTSEDFLVDKGREGGWRERNVEGRE